MAMFNIAVSPRTSLTYMTLGALTDVWTAIWYFAYGAREGMTQNRWFWVLGLFFSGLTLIVLGIALRPRKHTVVAQPEVTNANMPPMTAAEGAVAAQTPTAAGDYKMVPAPDAALTGAQIAVPTSGSASQVPAAPAANPNPVRVASTRPPM